MRQNKWLIYGTVTITIASLLAAFFIGKAANSIGYDICMAIFGSAFLGFIMSLIQYFSERRIGMEKFWKAAISALDILERIPFVDIDAPYGLVLNCLHEEELGDFSSHTAKDKLIKWFCNHYPSEFCANGELSINVDKIYSKRLQEYRKSIENCISVCLDIAKYDLSDLDCCYGNLDFLVRNKSFRKTVYDKIYVAIKDHYRQINHAYWYFNLQRKGDITLGASTDQLRQVLTSVFQFEFSFGEDDFYKTRVYQKSFYDIEVELAKFRAKIYHKSDYEEPELSLVVASSGFRTYGQESEWDRLMDLQEKESKNEK